MKKDKFFMFGILAIVSVFSVFLVGCGDLGIETSTENFMITIRNDSPNKVISYRVITENGITGSGNNYAYSSMGFEEVYIDGHYGLELAVDINDGFSKFNTPALNLEAGASSEKLGPFKVPFRRDRANASEITLYIWEEEDNQTHSYSMEAFVFPEIMRDSYNLVFDGSGLSEIN